MKNTLLLLLSMIFSLASYSQSYYVSAGGTYNDFDDKGLGGVKSPIGYYAGVSTNIKFHPHLGVTGSVLYMNQQAKVLDKRIYVNSAGGSFSFNYYPFKEGIKIIAGMHVAIANGNLGQRDLFALNAGLGYEMDKFEIIAKYNEMLSGSPFTSTTMVGLGYRFYQE